MKGSVLSIGALAATVALFAGVTAALAATHSTGRAATVSVATTSLGRVLVDGHGHTLYLFGRDAHGKSACAGTCASYWPPLIASGKPLARSGARASLLGTIRRSDGRLQVTYNHHPLYAFVKDITKGQTNGEGLDDFGGEWDALAPGGSKVEKSVADSGGSNPSAGGYGY
jgi:predicted lipoprotein with Yx(FWY)xxD motif